MGNAFTAANNVWVQTEKPTYFEGDQVNGTIYLNCVTPFNCRGLKIGVHGDERTYWLERRTESYTENGEAKTRHIEVPHNGRNQFFRVEVPVYNWQGQVMPGQYSFPFSFIIPPGLPGCFSAKSSEQATASISYRIVAECDVKGFFNFDIKHVQDMIVQQRLRAPILNTKTEAHEQITKCCCINKGSANLKAHLDKNAYVSGETAQIICEIENQSEIKFSNVKVELVRMLTLRSNQGGRHKSRDIVALRNYPGVGAGEVRAGQNSMHLPLQLGSGEPLSPTVYASLIDCEYYVEVLFVSDSIMVSNLDIKVNVTIYPPQPPAEIFVQQLPPGFNPTVMGPAVTVQLPTPAMGMMPPTGAPPPPQYASQPNYSDTTPLISGQPVQQYNQPYQQGQGVPQGQYQPQYS